MVGVGLHCRPGGHNHRSESHQRKSQFPMHRVAAAAGVVDAAAGAAGAAAAAGLESRHS